MAPRSITRPPDLGRYLRDRTPLTLALHHQLTRPRQYGHSRLLEEKPPPDRFLRSQHRSASMLHRREALPQLLKLALVIQGYDQLQA